jgi:hypothetical protein
MSKVAIFQQISDKLFLLWTLYRARNYQAFALSTVTTITQFLPLIRKLIKRFRYPIRSNYFCLKNDQATIDEIIEIILDDKHIIIQNIGNTSLKKFIDNNFTGKGAYSRNWIYNLNAQSLNFDKDAKITFKNAYIKIHVKHDGDFNVTTQKLYCRSREYYDKIIIPVNIPNTGEVTMITGPSNNPKTAKLHPIRFCPELYLCYDEISALISNWKNNSDKLKSLGGNKLSLVFEGPPGCGKTVLANHLAFLAGLPRVVEGKYDPKNKCISIGYTDAVIVFDDLDVLWAYDRNSAGGNSEIERERAEALKCFMEFLDGQNSGNIVVFTTNFPDSFDAALFRPGRINKRIKFDRLPFANCKKAAIDIYSDKPLISENKPLFSLDKMVEHDATSGELINLIKNNISDANAFVEDWNHYWTE